MAAASTLMGTSPNGSLSGATLFGRYSGRIYCVSTNQIQTFWLVNPVLQSINSYNNWGEIDIEIYNAYFIRTNTIIPTYSLHFGDGFPTVSCPAARDQTVVNPPGWHTWTIDWTPNYVAWYMDGNLRYVNNNNSTMPGWTEITGNGAESMLFPQSLMIGGYNPMAVTSASYAALQMQSFAATNYSANSGGVAVTDVEGNPYVGSLTNSGGYLRYDGVQSQWRNISIQVDCTNSGAQILIHTNSPVGPVVGTINVPVTRGPEWLYTDLVITNTTSQVTSATRPFNPGWDATSETGKTLIITGGTGFTPGNYTITAVSSKGVATLNAAAGVLNSKGGRAALQYPVPVRYTLASANLQPLNGSPQSIYLTFTGGTSGTGGLNLYNIYFFGMQPSSWMPTVTLTSSDAVGTSSFNAAGNWSNGQSPAATNNYLDAVGQLFTPSDSSDHVFWGNSLAISNGAAFSFRGMSSSANITVTNLILENGGILSQDMNNLVGAYTANLNGNIMLVGEGNAIQSQTAANEVLNINSTVGGAGSLTFAQKANGVGRTLTTFLNAANTYSGGTFLQASNKAGEAAVSLTVTHDGGLGVNSVTVSNLAVLTLTNGVSNAYINNQASLILVGSPVVNLDFSGTNTIYGLSFDGGSTFASTGIWGSPTSGAANTSSLFTGPGMLLVNPANAPPTILLQPASHGLYAGQTGQFKVVATGNPALTYQWQVGTNGNYVNLSDGGNISGSATPTLTISNVLAANAADYVAILTSSSFGSVASSVATLTVDAGNGIVWDSFTNTTVHSLFTPINGQPPEIGQGTWVSGGGWLIDSTNGFAAVGGAVQGEIAIPPPTNTITVRADVFPANYSAWVAIGFQIAPDTGGSWYNNFSNLLWVLASYNGGGANSYVELHGAVSGDAYGLTFTPDETLVLTYDPVAHAYKVLANGINVLSGSATLPGTIGSVGFLGNGAVTNPSPALKNFSVGYPPAPPSSNAWLTSLVLTPAGTLSPAFATNGFNYWATNVYGSSPSVTVSDADLTVTNELIYNGTPLQVLTSGVPSLALILNVGGTNVVEVLVTAQDGVTTNVYIVNVIESPPSVTPPYLTNSWDGSNLTLSWLAGYTLLTATNVFGPWMTNAGISPLLVTPTQPQQYFRLVGN
jgi:hypothetical protein